MPNYTYECKFCGRRFVLNRPIALRDLPYYISCTMPCPGEIVRVPDAPSFKVQGGTPRFHDKGR